MEYHRLVAGASGSPCDRNRRRRPDKLEKLAEALGVTKEEMDDLVLEDRLEQLGLDDPAFTMMFKEVPRMTKEEKQSLIKAYEAVLKARGRERQHETGNEASGGDS